MPYEHHGLTDDQQSLAVHLLESGQGNNTAQLRTAMGATQQQWNALLRSDPTFKMIYHRCRGFIIKHKIKPPEAPEPVRRHALGGIWGRAYFTGDGCCVGGVEPDMDAKRAEMYRRDHDEADSGW